MSHLKWDILLDKALNMWFGIFLHNLYLCFVINGYALVIWYVEHLWVEHVPVTMTQKDPIDFRVIGGRLPDQTLGHVRPIHAVLGNDCFRVKWR